MAVAPQILVPTAINNESFSGILNFILNDFTKAIVIRIHGITTIKALDPYWTKSMKLNLIPKKIIPSFNNLFKQKSYPGFNLEIYELFKFEKTIPIIIDMIIGDIGLFSNPKRFLPTKSDSLIDKDAVRIHNSIPSGTFLSNFIKSLYLYYYT